MPGSISCQPKRKLCLLHRWRPRLRKVKTPVQGRKGSERQDLNPDGLHRPQQALQDCIHRTQRTWLFDPEPCLGTDLGQISHLPPETKLNSPQPAGQEGIKLSSHLAGQGWVAVLCGAVGDHEVGPWRSEDKSGAPGQLLPTALRGREYRARKGLRKPGAVWSLPFDTQEN